MVPLVVAAVWLMVTGSGQGSTLHSTRNQLFGARLIPFLTALWLILIKWPGVGRWLLTLSASALVVLAHRHLGLPGTLCLLALPAGMAVAFISVKAGAAVSVAQTMLALGLGYSGLASGEEITPSVFMIWVTFGLLAAIYYPVYELAAWSWSRYQESQHLIAEARDRRGRLEQTLQDLQHANRQLSLDNQRMAALRTIADEAQRNKAAFVARVSHEFRAPLNMIIGLAGLMVDRPEVYAEELPPDLSADLEVIRRNSTHLAEMINDVLDLSQTEMGHLTLHRESVDLAEVVAEASQAVSPLIHKKGLRLEYNLPPGPLAVYCDRTRIRQVLLNLLSNAARFTENGSVTVAVSSSEDEVVVEVKDTGPGIAPHALSHIFEPFYRAPATSQNVTGSGLGLSISREIVHHHGGRIWVESESGQGTHFYFSLPTRPPMAPTARAGHEIVQDWIWHEDSFHTEAAIGRADLSRPLVIVHDPEDTLVREVQAEAQDIEVVVTHTADESLAMTDSNPGPRNSR